MASADQSNQTLEGTGRQAGITRSDAHALQSYEEELKNALRWARTVACLHAISRFLAFCILTWGCAVVLRAFASHLLLLDLILVACLLLLEAIRLASASFFAALHMRCTFSQLSQDPKHIIHSKDGVCRFVSLTCTQILQAILLSAGFIIPYIRRFGFASLRYDAKILNLENTLWIFYGLVAFNALVGLTGMTCSALAFASLNKPPEQSILRYYDKVLENAMKHGIVEAADFEFFSFAYTMLGRECGRNVQPEAVARSYRKLIQYLYAHRQGVDVLRVYLDADDTLIQLAAANMVRFWADGAWGLGLEEVDLPKELLRKLADKVETGQVADNKQVWGSHAKQRSFRLSNT